MFYRIVIVVLVLLTSSSCIFYLKRGLKQFLVKRKGEQLNYKNEKVKTRTSIIKQLKEDVFDICVIGGGCVGSGCALDAASRGLSVCLVEACDFGSQTSSKSTKMLHGGLRYLDKAISMLSGQQLKLVWDALYERYTIMRIAPYLTSVIEIMIPLYSVLRIPYYFLLIKLYDCLSWPKHLGESYFLGERLTNMRFTNLKNRNLVGSMVFSDGQMNDVRLVNMLVVTAHKYGAVTVNYVKFNHFIKHGDKIVKACCVDILTNEEIEITAHVFISAVGSFTDNIRQGSHPHIMTHSFGTHIVLNPQFAPFKTGIVDKETDDNRMLFILPWNGKVIVGSTENIGENGFNIKPTLSDVNFLKNEVQKYNSVKIEDSDILAAWCGVRPLVKDDIDQGSENIVRTYKVIDDNNGLIVVTGGKWTTYRTMARDAIDMAIDNYNLSATNTCLTQFLQLVGSKGFSNDLFYKISKHLNVSQKYAHHLQKYYGSCAFDMKQYLEMNNTLIHSSQLFRGGEVIYVIENEFALTIGDVINRRFGVGFVDVNSALKMAKPVARIMKRHLKWSNDRKDREIAQFVKELEEFGSLLLNNK